MAVHHRDAACPGLLTNKLKLSAFLRGARAGKRLSYCQGILASRNTTRISQRR